MKTTQETGKKILIALTEEEFYSVCSCVTWRVINKQKQITWRVWTRKRNDIMTSKQPQSWEIRELNKLEELDLKLLKIMKEIQNKHQN